jgi:hypothetical protein
VRDWLNKKQFLENLVHEGSAVKKTDGKGEGAHYHFRDPSQLSNHHLDGVDTDVDDFFGGVSSDVELSNAH